MNIAHWWRMSVSSIKKLRSRMRVLCETGRRSVGSRCRSSGSDHQMIGDKTMEGVRGSMAHGHWIRQVCRWKCVY